MEPAQRLLAFALVAISLAACDQQKGFDQMKLHVGEVGDVPVSAIVKPPARDGEITSWRTDFRGQVFAAVKTEAPCPRMIHTTAGVEFKKDAIELCFTAIPRTEPVPGFACSPEVFVKYEILGMPENVEPNFVFVGTCPTPPSQGSGGSDLHVAHCQLCRTDPPEVAQTATVRNQLFVIFFICSGGVRCLFIQ